LIHGDGRGKQTHPAPLIRLSFCSYISCSYFLFCCSLMQSSLEYFLQSPLSLQTPLEKENSALSSSATQWQPGKIPQETEFV